jgi:hypothetical protein
MEDTLYKFYSKSSLSFKVILRGRETYVNFSAYYRGASRFFTTDADMAAQIRKHRWFRVGVITEEVARAEETQEAKEQSETTEAAETQPEEQTQNVAKKVYSILGKKMSVPTTSATESTSAASATESTSAASEETATAADLNAGDEKQSANDANESDEAISGDAPEVNGSDENSTGANDEASTAAESVQSTTMTAEMVESFIDAKEFFVENYGLERSKITSKVVLTELCEQYGVTFPNYTL